MRERNLQEIPVSEVGHVAYEVGEKGDFAEGSVRAVFAGGRKLAIINTGGEFFSFDDVCPHEECSLSEYGEVSGYEICCTCHMSSFDLRTGTAIAGPAFGDAVTFPVIVSNDAVSVMLGESSDAHNGAIGGG